jgi:predicted dehydrogenase
MNILIIGLGSIAFKHISVIREINPNVLIYALRSSLKSEEHKGIINIYELNSTNIKFDFAIISNPTYLHYEFIELLSKKGINLFIEKPLVHSLIDLDRLIEFTENSHIINYVACNLRFHPCIQFLKSKIHNKRINELNVYCGSYLPEWRPTKDFRNLYSSNPDMGGGVHLDLFHEFDYTFWIFGTPISCRRSIKSRSSLNIASIDYANYLLEYDTFSASLILNYYRRDPKRTVEVLFENETWSIDLINNTIINNQGEIIYKWNKSKILNTYYNQMKYYIKCLEEKSQPMNSLKESAEILKFVLYDE